MTTSGTVRVCGAVAGVLAALLSGVTAGCGKKRGSAEPGTEAQGAGASVDVLLSRLEDPEQRALALRELTAALDAALEGAGETERVERLAAFGAQTVGPLLAAWGERESAPPVVASRIVCVLARTVAHVAERSLRDRVIDEVLLAVVAGYGESQRLGAVAARAVDALGELATAEDAGGPLLDPGRAATAVGRIAGSMGAVRSGWGCQGRVERVMGRASPVGDDELFLRAGVSALAKLAAADADRVSRERVIAQLAETATESPRLQSLGIHAAAVEALDGMAPHLTVEEVASAADALVEALFIEGTLLQDAAGGLTNALPCRPEEGPELPAPAELATGRRAAAPSTGTEQQERERPEQEREQEQERDPVLEGRSEGPGDATGRLGRRDVEDVDRALGPVPAEIGGTPVSRAIDPTAPAAMPVGDPLEVAFGFGSPVVACKATPDATGGGGGCRFPLANAARKALVHLASVGEAHRDAVVAALLRAIGGVSGGPDAAALGVNERVVLRTLPCGSDLGHACEGAANDLRMFKDAVFPPGRAKCNRGRDPRRPGSAFDWGIDPGLVWDAVGAVLADVVPRMTPERVAEGEDPPARAVRLLAGRIAETADWAEEIVALRDAAVAAVAACVAGSVRRGTGSEGGRSAEHEPQATCVDDSALPVALPYGASTLGEVSAEIRRLTDRDNGFAGVGERLWPTAAAARALAMIGCTGPDDAVVRDVVRLARVCRKLVLDHSTDSWVVLPALSLRYRAEIDATGQGTLPLPLYPVLLVALERFGRGPIEAVRFLLEALSPPDTAEPDPFGRNGMVLPYLESLRPIALRALAASAGTDGPSADELAGIPGTRGLAEAIRTLDDACRRDGGTYDPACLQSAVLDPGADERAKSRALLVLGRLAEGEPSLLVPIVGPWIDAAARDPGRRATLAFVLQKARFDCRGAGADASWNATACEELRFATLGPLASATAAGIPEPPPSWRGHGAGPGRTRPCRDGEECPSGLPDLRFGPPACTGGLAWEVVRRIVAQHRGRIRRCHEVILQADPGVAGTVVIDLAIEPSGRVRSADPTADATGSAELAACIADIFTEMRFPQVNDPTSCRVSLQFRTVASE